MTNTNTTLNQAIWTVLNTQFKKDARDAFKTVEANGYQIDKNGGGYWTVRNNRTKKFVYISYNRYGYGGNIVHGHYYSQQTRFRNYNHLTEIAKKFDFVNCLNTPYNTEYDDILCNRIKFVTSQAKLKYDRFKSAKWSVDYEINYIAKIQKQIAELQNELIRRTETKVRDMQTLENVRKEIGLSK